MFWKNSARFVCLLNTSVAQAMLYICIMYYKRKHCCIFALCITSASNVVYLHYVLQVQAMLYIALCITSASIFVYLIYLLQAQAMFYNCCMYRKRKHCCICFMYYKRKQYCVFALCITNASNVVYLLHVVQAQSINQSNNPITNGVKQVIL